MHMEERPCQSTAERQLSTRPGEKPRKAALQTPGPRLPASVPKRHSVPAVHTTQPVVFGCGGLILQETRSSRALVWISAGELDQKGQGLGRGRAQEA